MRRASLNKPASHKRTISTAGRAIAPNKAASNNVAGVSGEYRSVMYTFRYAMSTPSTAPVATSQLI